MIRGRTRNPPRRLYATSRITNGMRLSTVFCLSPCSFDRLAPIPITPMSRTVYCRMLRNVPMLRRTRIAVAPGRSDQRIGLYSCKAIKK
jgi:hypothetical protein